MSPVSVIGARVPNRRKGPPVSASESAALPEGSKAKLSVVKGLRVVSDFESEMHQAHMNLAISGVHTVFVPSATEHSFVASKLIREIARFGGDVTSMVPPPVAKRLTERYGA